MSRGQVDRDCQRFVDEVCAASARLRADAGGAPDLPRMRAIAEQVRAPWRRGGPEVSAQDFEIPLAGDACRVRVYRPADLASPAPVLLYLHGGGWTMFSVDTHDRLMREYAAQARVVVVGIDYALAPEHPYPLALQQCLAAVAWLCGSADTLGVDPTRLALGGDSAGANLALSTALLLREVEPFPGPRALLLNYGAFDTEMSAQAQRDLGGGDAMLTAAEMNTFWRHYLGASVVARRDVLAQPLRAALHGLPPACVIAAGRDVLCEQSEALHARLRDAGVHSELKRYDNAPHSFLEAMSISALARRAIADGATFLAGRLHADAGAVAAAAEAERVAEGQPLRERDAS